MASKFLRHLLDFSSVVLSSVLLVFSFPKFDVGFFAWVGLLPLLIGIKGENLRYGFFYSLLCGIFFFLGIFHWILEIPNYTLLHHSLLAVYLGTYFGFFGLAFNFIATRWSCTAALWAAPFIWVSLEYIRGNLSFLALPWGFLGHSQYRYPSIIQIASLTGTYSISFLIVMLNAAIAAIMYPFVWKLTGQKIPPNLPFPKGGVTTLRSRATTSPPLTKGDGGGFGIDKGRKGLVALTVLLIILTILYGQLTIAKPITGNRVKVSLVQGNIDQYKKWDPKYAREIMEIYTDLTQEVAKDQPALIIWPETATPGAINQNIRLQMEVRNIAKKAGTHLLLGSSQHQKFTSKEKREFKYSNSVFLIPPESNLARNQRYDKIRLFPFGEYLPYKGIIPWSFINASALDNYTPGKEFTVFEHPEFRFGAIICWENVFPDLVRQFVKSGAQCIINPTNEAWFGKTAAPYQLVSMSVLRAVENRIFMVRCGNTGVSCIIDPYGRIVDRIKDEGGHDIFIRGKMSGWITPLDLKTIYTQYGDFLVWVAIFGSLIILGISVRKATMK